MAISSTQGSSAAAEFLLRRINYERTTSVPYRTAEFKLDRMRRLMHLLGDPHHGLKAIHIAGTKGKGSTAAMIAAVLQESGQKTGLYTSPHLERVEERIAINGQQCPADSFLRLAEQVQPAVEQLDREGANQGETGPTFFEVTTAMAFLYFAQEQVNTAVLEVGLGGRLDSTNVCRPEVCVITSISFDHVKQLGNTLASIAGEKAGIIKPGVPVVSGVLAAEPRQVIAARAAELGAPLYQRGSEFEYRAVSWQPTTASQSLDYFEPAHHSTFELKNIQTRLIGSHQAANAAAAVATAIRLRDRGWSISDAAIRDGISKARVPARIEQIQTAPFLILDVAHNLASIEALLTVLREKFTARRRVLIFASSKDKDYGGMLNLLLPAFDVIFLTQYINNPRAVEAGELLTLAQQIRANASTPKVSQVVLHAAARPADALRLAKAIAQSDDLICIAGSFFLAAELRPLL